MKYNADKNTKTEIKRGIIERERAKRYKSTISVQTRLIVLRIFATESWSFFILTIRTRGAETTREIEIGVNKPTNIMDKIKDKKYMIRLTLIDQFNPNKVTDVLTP